MYITLANLLFFMAASAQDMKHMKAQQSENKSTLIQDLESRVTFQGASTTVSTLQDNLLPNTGYIASILDYAKTHLGKKYRSGGKGPNVFDCSGFVGFVFRHFGFTMGASSRDQYLQGTEVEQEKLRPGDLLFFGGRKKSKTTVGHVGIVTNVDPETKQVQFIHAATSVGIKIDRFPDGGYYSNRYIGAKRIIE